MTLETGRLTFLEMLSDPEQDGSFIENPDSGFWNAINFSRDTAISGPDGLILVPLHAMREILDQLEPGSWQGMAEYFCSAYTSSILRQGYLDTTPDTIPGILALLDQWDQQPETILYAFGFDESEPKKNTSGEPGDYEGYVCFKCHRDSDTQQIEVEVTYGLFYPEHGGRQYTSRATRTAIDALVGTFKRFQAPIHSFKTTVSDQNTWSRRILERLGFIIDTTQEISEAPTRMGGTNIHMELIVQDE